MARRLSKLWFIFCAVTVFAIFWFFGFDYIFKVGFPLDDSWIQMVYGRSLATTGEFAYNPGDRAVGLTSLLWAALVSVPHFSLDTIPLRIFAVKLIGLMLHCGTVYLLSLLARRQADNSVFWVAASGVFLASIHPDMLSAAVSGMEIPLATTVAVLFAVGVLSESKWIIAIGAVLAPLSRPEIYLFCITVPLFYFGKGLFRRRDILFAIGGGSLVGWGIIVSRCLLIWGYPLPSTFYAKVGEINLSLLEYIRRSSKLLKSLPLADATLLVLTLTLTAIYFLTRPTKKLSQRKFFSSLFLSAIVFIAVSILMIPPVDPEVFYHQRFILPALPYLIFTMPILLFYSLERLASRHITINLCVLFCFLSCLSISIDLPDRFERLANDARNIDDIQVQIGRTLSSVKSSKTIWLTDAGAIRYFGNAHCVDLIGLNTSEILTNKAQEYLNGHSPNYFHIVPGWLRLEGNNHRLLEFDLFEAVGQYTVTSNPLMGKHYLATCKEKHHGKLQLLTGNTYRYKCR